MTIVPNTFQCFNVYIDRAMELLTDTEFRCLLFATRHIMGWQNKIEKRCGVISLSMFEHGFVDGNENRYAGTGLSRNTIIKTTASLTKYGFFERVGHATSDGQEWRLAEQNIDWLALEQRKAKRDVQNKKRTQRATAASPKTKAQGGTSDVTGNVGRDVTGTSDVTGGGTSDVTESKPYQNQVKNQDSIRIVTSRYFIPALVKAMSTASDKIIPIDADSYQDWLTALATIFDTVPQSAILRHWYNVFNNRATSGKWQDANISPPATLDEVRRWHQYEIRESLNINGPRHNPHTQGKFVTALNINNRFLRWRAKAAAIENEKQARAELEKASA